MLKMFLIGLAAMAILGAGFMGFVLADAGDISIPEVISRRGGYGCDNDYGGPGGSNSCGYGSGSRDCSGSGEDCDGDNYEDCPNYEDGDCQNYRNGGCGGGGC